MTTLICDCETDGLLEDMTAFHMFQIGDADGDDAVVYVADPAACRALLPEGVDMDIRAIPEGIARIQAADRVVFHNGIGYDFWAINRFFPGLIQREKMLDTLVMARLSDPEERNHSLKAWGERTGTLKGSYKGDFSKIDLELLLYAPQDIHAGRALWHRVKHVLDWQSSVLNACELEHGVAWAINAQERNGFCFDTKGAEALDLVLRSEIDQIKVVLQETFPPRWKADLFTPKVNNKTRGYVKGVEIDKGCMEAFNPASRAHVAERLQALGWKPKAGEMGDNGVPTVDEKTLSRLPYPECKPLMRYFRLLKMLGQLSDGKQGWLRLVKPDGRMHGRVNPNGASTGRMSHFGPNVAQTDKDPRMRALFGPRRGWLLVGCDAEGLEARCLGHRLAAWDLGAFTTKVVSGVKEDGTDVHTSNLNALKSLGLVSRDGAKTFLYALELGASAREGCRTTV